MLLTPRPAARVSPTSPPRCSSFAIEELAAGLQEIRELASGLHPSRAHRARPRARRSRRSRCARPCRSSSQALPDERLPEPVEAAAYYVVAEALANVQKHAGARRVVVRVDGRRATGSTSRSPTTASAAPTRTGSGLRGLADRVEALGGRLTLDSPRRGGTRLRAEIPRVAPHAYPAA